MGQKKTIKRTTRRKYKKRNTEKNIFLQKVMDGMNNILMPPR